MREFEDAGMPVPPAAHELLRLYARFILVMLDTLQGKQPQDAHSQTRLLQLMTSNSELLQQAHTDLHQTGQKPAENRTEPA